MSDRPRPLKPRRRFVLVPPSPQQPLRRFVLVPNDVRPPVTADAAETPPVAEWTGPPPGAPTLHKPGAGPPPPQAA